MASSISEELKARIRMTAANRCGYCLTHQSYVPWKLEIEHIIPQSKGGQTRRQTSGWPAALVIFSKAIKLTALIPSLGDVITCSIHDANNGDVIFAGARMGDSSLDEQRLAVQPSWH